MYPGTADDSQSNSATMFNMGPSGCLNDNSFGPHVLGCRGDFDFTLQFEQIFLSILPSCIFMSAAFVRLVVLIRRPTMVEGFIFRLIKSVSIVTPFRCPPPKTRFMSNRLIPCSLALGYNIRGPRARHLVSCGGPLRQRNTSPGCVHRPQLCRFSVHHSSILSRT